MQVAAGPANRQLPLAAWRGTRILLQTMAFVTVGAIFTLLWNSSVTSLVGLLIMAAIAAGVILLATYPGLAGDIAAYLRSFKSWQTLWFCIFLSGLVFRERDSHNIESNPVDAWALFRIALTTLTAMWLLWRLVVGNSNWIGKARTGSVGLLSAYCLACLISSCWSVYPAWTLYKSFELLVDVVLLAAIVGEIASADDSKRLFDWTWVLLSILLISIWAGLLIAPRQALEPSDGILGFQLAGLIPSIDPNSVGEMAAVIGLVALARTLQPQRRMARRAIYGFVLAVSVVTLGLAQARSAILGFAIGGVLVLLCSRRVALTVLLATAAAGVFSLRNMSTTFLAFMSRGETTEQLYSLSSRVDWWSYAWPKILEHPFVGYGAFAGARFFVMAQLKVDAGIHSDWLEILIGTGLFGAIIAFWAVASTWRVLMGSLRRRGLSARERNMAIEAIGVLALLSIRSVFSPALFGHPPLAFLAVVAYGEFLRVRKSLPAIVLAALPASGAAAPAASFQ